MEELRWILLIVGVGLIAGIYFLGDPKPEKDSTDGGNPLDEDLEKELKNLEKVVSDRDRVGDESASPVATSAKPHASVLISDPDSILTLYLSPLGTLTKQQIFSAADETGLEFGDLNIFHRLQTGSQNGGQAIFSVANITKPGDFDPAAPEHLPSSGLCLFLTLPNPMSALDAWDAMLATGQRLSALLECEIQDESHCTLTRQRIAHIREQMREYDRKQAILR